MGVGDSDSVQLFYYFIESERDPDEDPLVLWLTGGPGCSGFSGLVFEVGPLLFDYAKSSSGKVKVPVLKLNPYSWTKVSNMIFIDAPVGTGFSYATNSEAYVADDTSSATQTNEFLRKWLSSHPRFLKHPLYISGDSYSGIIIPILVNKISDGNARHGLITRTTDGCFMAVYIRSKIERKQHNFFLLQRLPKEQGAESVAYKKFEVCSS